jgi:hypothetical protein
LHQRNAGFHGKYWAGHFIIGRIKNQVKYEEEEAIPALKNGAQGMGE